MPIFSILQLVNLGNMIAKIIIKRAIIFSIIIIIITMAVSHEKQNVLFVAKNVVTLTSIQMISNGEQKNFKNKTENFAKINRNITYFWLILKRI